MCYDGVGILCRAYGSSRGRDRATIISDDWMNLTDEEEVYNFVYEQIRQAWEESERYPRAKYQ